MGEADESKELGRLWGITPTEAVQVGVDSFNRPIMRDEIGEYIVPTSESREYARFQYKKILERIEREWEDREKIKERLSGLQAKRTQLVAKRFKDGIGDGRDLNHAAPKITDEIKRLGKEVYKLDCSNKQMWTELFQLCRGFTVELLNYPE